MKKLWVLLPVLAVFISCTNVTETEEYKALQTKNDSLMSVSSNQGADIYNYIADFNNIQENLNKIKEVEKIIDVKKSGEQAMSNRDQINEDIQTIYNLLKENQQKLASMNKKYKNSDYKNKELQKLIETLQAQVEANQNEILALNKELESLNIEIKGLTDDLLSMQTENEDQAQVIEAQDQAIHTAYYVVGTSKELKEHKIITKEGGFIGLGRNSKLDNGFDTSYFTEINTGSFKEIAIYAKKAKLITTHPAGTYEFEGNGEKVDKLIIKDADKFWSVSKYLVIEITQ
ncbi:MAG: hypothetical protein JXR60_07645 [Bacteroidales bacterium]|nr:hypothetical protein [Bacteroidales bacterium]